MITQISDVTFGHSPATKTAPLQGETGNPVVVVKYSEPSTRPRRHRPGSFDASQSKLSTISSLSSFYSAAGGYTRANNFEKTLL